MPHATPAVQLTQAPFPSHTWLVPQVVPAEVLVVASTQVSTPVLHEVTPALHGFGFVGHAAPAVHETQAPEASQT